MLEFDRVHRVPIKWELSGQRIDLYSTDKGKARELHGEIWIVTRIGGEKIAGGLNLEEFHLESSTHYLLMRTEILDRIRERIRTQMGQHPPGP
jgi:hypothetical protein